MDAGLGHTEANIPNMFNIIKIALDSDSVADKDAALMQLAKLL